MRFIARSLGLLLSAATFVCVIIDGTRSIADEQWAVLPLRAVWQWLSAGSFAHVQAWINATLSALVWNDLVSPVLGVPFSLVLAALSGLFFWLGRKPRSRIGYVSHV